MQTSAALIASLGRCLNHHDAEGCAFHYAPNATLVTADGTIVKGRAGIAAHFAEYFTAFPDLQVTMDRLVPISPSSSYCTTTFRGTHLGPLKTGETTVAPTYRPFTYTFITYVAVNEAGQADETKSWGDSLAIPRQLGLVPYPLSQEQMIGIAQRYWQAAGSGDVSAVMACFTPGATMTLSSGTVLNRAAIEELWTRVFSAYPGGAQYKDATFTVEGATVIAAGKITAVQSGKLWNGTSTGRSFTADLVEVCEVDPGGIVRIQRFLDMATIGRQLGLA